MQTTRQKRDESDYIQTTDYIKSPWTKLEDRMGEDISRICKESSNQQEEISKVLTKWGEDMNRYLSGEESPHPK